MTRLVERIIGLSPFRSAKLTQLPYVVPGVASALRLKSVLSGRLRRPTPLPTLDERFPPEDMEVHKPCPLCAAQEVVVRYRPSRRDGDGKIVWRYRVGQCPRCDLWYRVPALKPERVPELYDTGTYANYLEGAYAKNRRRRYRATLDAFSPALDTGNGRKLLDVGCGTGLFMQLAEKRGFVAHGIDLASDAVATAQATFGEDRVACGTPEDMIDDWQDTFDVITLWSVLAHLPEPKNQLAALHDMLTPGGQLMIMTVNAASLQRLAFGGRWNGFTRGHLIFWSRDTVRRLLDEIGFASVEFAEFYGEAIEMGRSRLPQRQRDRYRRAVDHDRSGNMLRVLATKTG